MIHPTGIIFSDLGAALRGLSKPLQTSALQPWRQRAALGRQAVIWRKVFLDSPSVTSHLIKVCSCLCRISQHLLTSSPGEKSSSAACQRFLPAPALATTALFPLFLCCFSAGWTWEGALKGWDYSAGVGWEAWHPVGSECGHRGQQHNDPSEKTKKGAPPCLKVNNFG